VGHTPNLSNVSANLKLMNENPAKNVTLKLQSGEVDEEVDACWTKDQRFWKAMPISTIRNRADWQDPCQHRVAACQSVRP
jgi:DNA-binding protein